MPVNALAPFNFHGSAVRVQIDEQGNPWFVARDVCECLGLENVSRATSRLREVQKGVTTSNTLGGPQDFTTVNESGLFDLVLTSRKPEAQAFRAWVTDEVLPSIRRTGSYGVPKSPAQIVGFAERVVGLLTEAQEIINRQAEQLAAAAPKVEFVDRYVDAEGLCGLQQAGRLLGHGPNRLIESMKRDGVLFYQGRALVPKAEHVERGRFTVKTLLDDVGKARVQTYVTTAGVEWLASRYGRQLEVQCMFPGVQ